MPAVKKSKTQNVGPWPKGLFEVNYLLSEEQRDLPDDALAHLVNFEVTDEGFLVPRRGFRYVYATATGGNQWDVNATPTMRGISVIGSVKKNDDEYVIVFAKEPATNTVWSSNDPPNPASWVKMHTFTGTTDYWYACCQYADVIYFCRGETDVGSGGYSTPIADLSTLGTWTSQANIPKGNEMFVWKDRVWVTNSTLAKVQYSKATDPTIWAAPDGGFFLVSPGDGEVMTDTVLMNNQMFIFKERKAFRFLFSDDPGDDGALLPISDTIGGYPIAGTDRIFLVSYNGLYQIINDQFINISHNKIVDQNIETIYRPMIVQNTLYFSWRVNNVDVCYSMNLNTGAFSLLDTGSVANNWPARVSHKSARFSNDLFNFGNGYVVEAIENTKTLWFVLDNPLYQTDQSSNKSYYVPQYRCTTKMYDFGDGFTSKKIKRVWLDGKMIPIFNSGNNIRNHFLLRVSNLPDLGVEVSTLSKYSLAVNHPSTLTGDQGYGGPVRARAIYFQWFENVSYQTTEASTILNGRTSAIAAEPYEIRKFIVDYTEYEKRRS